MKLPEQLQQFKWREFFVKNKITQPIFYTLSGSHLYGFDSKDSDFDIRGCHIEPLREVIGLHAHKKVRNVQDGDLDFESFDIQKEVQLILSNNSNVMEHWAAEPIYKGKPYAEFKTLVEKSISKQIAKPYWGMAMHNLHKYLRTWNESYREAPVKKYLYVLRALMAGIYVLDSGRIEPNIDKLNKIRKFQIPIVTELIKLKKAGREKDFIAGCPEAEEAINKLMKMFDVAKEASTLPSAPTTYHAFNEFLIKWRLS